MGRAGDHEVSPDEWKQMPDNQHGFHIHKSRPQERGRRTAAPQGEVVIGDFRTGDVRCTLICSIPCPYLYLAPQVPA